MTLEFIKVGEKANLQLKKKKKTKQKKRYSQPMQPYLYRPKYASTIFMVHQLCGNSTQQK